MSAREEERKNLKAACTRERTGEIPADEECDGILSSIEN